MSVALFVVLLFVSSFFSGSETALFSLGKVAHTRLRHSERGRDRLISRLISRPRELLVTVLLGNELTNIALSIVSASIAASWLSEYSLATQALISACVVVPLLLIIGEITPKTIAAHRPERVANFVARPLSLFARLTTPVRTNLRWLTDQLSRLVGVPHPARHKRDDEPIDEDEFRTLIKVGAEEGVVEHQERVLIMNVLDFGDLRVSKVMRPLEEVTTIDARAPLESAIELAARKRYSRVPVWLKSPRDIVGVIYSKDLLSIRWGARRATHIRALMRHPIYTLPNRPAAELLDELRQARTHMAIVVDEFGRALGICTMEDLLEELFGPITDRSPRAITRPHPTHA